jgi:hypothetical protein
MIILGIALLIIGSPTKIEIAWMIGIVALVVGLVLILSARSAPGGWPPLPVTARGSAFAGTPGPRRKRYGNAGGPGDEIDADRKDHLPQDRGDVPAGRRRSLAGDG